MQYITSSSNNLIKEVAKYKDGKDDAILVEGIKIIKEVAKYGLYCSKLFALEDKFDLVTDDAILDAVFAEYDKLLAEEE